MAPRGAGVRVRGRSADAPRRMPDTGGDPAEVVGRSVRVSSTSTRAAAANAARLVQLQLAGATVGPPAEVWRVMQACQAAGIDGKRAREMAPVCKQMRLAAAAHPDNNPPHRGTLHTPSAWRQPRMKSGCRLAHRVSHPLPAERELDLFGDFDSPLSPAQSSP